MSEKNKIAALMILMLVIGMAAGSLFLQHVATTTQTVTYTWTPVGHAEPAGNSTTFTTSVNFNVTIGNSQGFVHNVTSYVDNSSSALYYYQTRVLGVAYDPQSNTTAILFDNSTVYTNECDSSEIPVIVILNSSQALQTFNTIRIGDIITIETNMTQTWQQANASGGGIIEQNYSCHWTITNWRLGP